MITGAATTSTRASARRRPRVVRNHQIAAKQTAAPAAPASPAAMALKPANAMSTANAPAALRNDRRASQGCHVFGGWAAGAGGVCTVAVILGLPGRRGAWARAVDGSASVSLSDSARGWLLTG